MLLDIPARALFGVWRAAASPVICVSWQPVVKAKDAIVARCLTAAFTTTWPIFSLTRPHPRSLLSIARSNIAKSRTRCSRCKWIQIAQTCLGLSGGFGPTKPFVPRHHRTYVRRACKTVGGPVETSIPQRPCRRGDRPRVPTVLHALLPSRRHFETDHQCQFQPTAACIPSASPQPAIYPTRSHRTDYDPPINGRSLRCCATIAVWHAEPSSMPAKTMTDQGFVRSAPARP